eukprot:TRINITY_DN465_c1_g1_i9.p1 TRINITY_DN465_c1_g1~~TRINITY_DN465_c1_g1_i9.p1  ORF type:complete len:108 (+),score=4.78 TRINITY_DN465_c1_g1_i9:213-536(+)
MKNIPLRCTCDNGQTTHCWKLCGYCRGCLGCPKNSTRSCRTCVPLKANCEHAPFNIHPDCTCEDGVTTCCTNVCSKCSGCLDCLVNLRGGVCGCLKLKDNCDHSHDQ